MVARRSLLQRIARRHTALVGGGVVSGVVVSSTLAYRAGSEVALGRRLHERGDNAGAGSWTDGDGVLVARRGGEFGRDPWWSRRRNRAKVTQLRTVMKISLSRVVAANSSDGDSAPCEELTHTRRAAI